MPTQYARLLLKSDAQVPVNNLVEPFALAKGTKSTSFLKHMRKERMWVRKDVDLVPLAWEDGVEPV